MTLSPNKPLVLLGSGGHARSVAALLNNNNIMPVGVYDDSWKASEKELIVYVPLVGKISNVPAEALVVLAVGDNHLRSDLFLKFSNQLYKNPLVHSSSMIDETATLGEANLVFAKVFINAEVVIGNNNIVNTGALLEHECAIGNNCHISVGAIICGRVKVGDNCFIGAGVVIKDKVKICADTTIGAGAVVVKDIIEPGIYVGNPAKKIK